MIMICFSVQAGGFDKLLLDSLYEDDSARRHIQLQNAGYGHAGMAVPNPFEHQQHDPFAMSNSIAPPTNVQMALLAQQQQQHQHLQQMMLQQQQQQHQQMNMMVSYQNQTQYPQQPQLPQHQQQMQQMNYSNPFGDPFLALPNGSTPQQGNHMLL